MEILEHKTKDVTDNLVQLVPYLHSLQIRVIQNNIVQIPETDNERKLVGMCASMGYDETKKEYYSVTDNLVLILAKAYPLQLKKEIFEVWNLLNSQRIALGKCVICGKENEYFVDPRSKRCRDEKCEKIHDLLIWYFKRIINHIEKVERRFVCSYCNKEYNPNRKDSKFCSGKCRVYQFRKGRAETLNKNQLNKETSKG